MCIRDRWSPDGGRIAYMHALPSCAPPYNPNWYSADPCVNDIHAVRLSDGLDEDLGVMPANDKFGVEPEWLQNGQISYFWMCFDEGCNDQGGWYETLLPGASAGSIRNYANMTYAAYGGAWSRQRAHKRDASTWAAVGVVMAWLWGSPARGVHVPGTRKPDQGPIVLCSRDEPWGYPQASCSDLVNDPMAWSPRWNPEESRVAYQRTDGIWVTNVPVITGTAPTQIFAATNEITGFDW